MKPREEDLVRVQSESELQPGMTVWIRNCNHCGGTDTMVLVDWPRSTTASKQCGACRREQWVAIRSCAYEMANCFCDSIATRRLYRLRDLDTHDEQTTERKRERVE